MNKKILAKISAALVGVAMVLSFVVTPVTADAQTAQCYTFSSNLTVGSRGTDVMNLQKTLNMSSDTQVASTGAGSMGNETTYFGQATKAAVMKFQKKHGISPVAGFVGSITRAKLNSMCSGGTTTGGTTTGGTTTTGGALTVSSASQPANGLAPQGASRVPFTTLTLTAGSADVTVNSITVERTGLAQDAVFGGVVLLNSDGTQIGIAKTLNSDHRAMVGEPFVVKAGTSKTVTVAGNMASSLTNYAGQVAGLNVVAVNTSATVGGSLPIMGAMHTINGTLTLGSVTMNISSFDPNTAQTKEIGTTGYKFAGIRVTAGSVEKVKIQSIRWNQSGSASSNDLANVVVYVDGTAYPTTVSADGKYYSANLGSGISVDKGASKDIYIQGDIVGTGAAGRTIKFDIYKTTDLYLSGETYGYGITPPAGAGTASDSSSEFTASTPWFDGSKVTVSAGSVTTIQKANSVAAANIAVNVPNQVLGGFQADIKGEPISVQSMVYYFNYSAGVAASSYLLTNVSLVDSNGAVVAGPVDATNVGGVAQKVTFTDTVTFPVGQKTYTLKGKIPSGVSNNTTITASTTPSSDWSNITGQTTGNTISLSGNGVFSMNTMTVKSAALAISVATTPSAQTVVAGGSAREFARYQFDASQSGEDVRFSTLPLKVTYSGSAANMLNSCQLFDGSTALNTGSNVVNPTAAQTSGGDVTFTLDQALTIPKGTVKTISLKCNISSSATTSATYAWGIQASPSISVTGITSSNDVTETVSASAGQTQTIGNGYLTIATGDNDNGYSIVSANTTGNIVATYKVKAVNESINLNKLGLKLTNSASSSASDLVQVTVWDGPEQVGSVVFTGSNTVATTSFTKPVSLPKDTDKVLTIKADFAAIGTSQPGTQGHLIAIDVNGSDTTGTEGTGADSGSTINLATSNSSASTAVEGVRLFKSYPTFTKLSLGTSGNKLNNGEQKLLRFSVTPNAGGSLGIYKFTLRVATTVATVTGINIRAYTDSSFSLPVSGLSSDGSMLSSNLAGTAWASSSSDLEVFAQTSAGATTTIQTSSPRYFEVIGTVSGTGTGASIQTQIQGDSAYPSLSGFMGNGLTINNDSNNDFIWSPNATTTSVYANNDWTNGYRVSGLPASNMSAEVLSY